MNRTLGLGIEGIVVSLDDNKGGVITSHLHYGEENVGDGMTFETMEDLYCYESAIDALESLILAHACSGIDILSKEYREGVQTALDAILNRM